MAARSARLSLRSSTRRKRPRSRRRSRVRCFRLIPRTSRRPRVVQEVRVGVAPQTENPAAMRNFGPRNGETRTRTGDTTIFSRARRPGRDGGIPGIMRFRPGCRAHQIFAVCGYLSPFVGMADASGPNSTRAVRAKPGAELELARSRWAGTLALPRRRARARRRRRRLPLVHSERLARPKRSASLHGRATLDPPSREAEPVCLLSWASDTLRQPQCRMPRPALPRSSGARECRVGSKRAATRRA